MRSRSQECVSVYRGPPVMAEMLAGVLYDNGIPAQTPELNIKQLDPFFTGGSIFDVEVLVPRGQAERAAELVAPSAADGAAAEQPPRGETERLAELRRRAGWCAVDFRFAPVGVWLGLKYLFGARTAGQPVDRSWRTVLPLLLCVLSTLFLAALLLFAMQEYQFIAFG